MACLVVIEGPTKGQQFALERHRIVMIGREDDCTFQILDKGISRHHLQIKQDGERHKAVDFNSANGVLVNGARIAEPVYLDEGDLIHIGATDIVYMETDLPDAKRVTEAVKRRGERWAGTMQLAVSPEQNPEQNNND